MEEITTIMVFGDSITYGAVDNELGGWVNRLRLHFDNQSDEDFNIFNLGIPGETTEEILNRFEYECKARCNEANKTIILFAVGINDTQDTNGDYIVTRQHFAQNIKELINKARRFTQNILFIGPTKVDETKVIPLYRGEPNISYFNKRIIEFDNLLESVCNEEKILYLKMYNLLSQEDLSDGLHPNSIGHEKMFGMILNKIKDIIMR